MDCKHCKHCGAIVEPRELVDSDGEPWSPLLDESESPICPDNPDAIWHELS